MLTANHTAVQAQSTTLRTNVLIFLASMLSVYLPPVVVLARDAHMRDQLVADLHD